MERSPIKTPDWKEKSTQSQVNGALVPALSPTEARKESQAAPLAARWLKALLSAGFVVAKLHQS